MQLSSQKGGIIEWTEVTFAEFSNSIADARRQVAAERYPPAVRPIFGEATMSTSQRYLGARTAFGIIISVVDCLYNPEAVVKAKDGSTQPYRLPFLIAHGLELSKPEADVQQDVGTVQPNS